MQPARTESIDAPAPSGVSRAALERALRRLVGADAMLTSVRSLAGDRAEGERKHIGYGEPVLLSYRLGSERGRAPATQERHLVFRTLGPNWFGHDRRSDRASLALLAADTYDVIPQHVRIADVGAIGPMGELISLSGSGEFYLVTSYADGALYAQDLRRVEMRRRAEPLDLQRAEALAGYIAALHAVPPRASAPELYIRAIRDLVGSGEGIFGIVDSYPDPSPVARTRLAAIEQRCVVWRERLRPRTDRLVTTHGDFHPYNVLFREGIDFTVLDTSRGAIGEAADDVAAMAINFFFGGVVEPAAWADGFRPLWETFWNRYIDATGDDAVREVIAPFLAWRALVLASPVWYPDVSDRARNRLLALAEMALASDAFDPKKADEFIR